MFKRDKFGCSFRWTFVTKINELPWFDLRASEFKSTFAGTWFVRKFGFFSIWMGWFSSLNTRHQLIGFNYQFIIVVAVALEVDVSSTWSLRHVFIVKIHFNWPWFLYTHWLRKNFQFFHTTKWFQSLCYKYINSIEGERKLASVSLVSNDDDDDAK